MSNDQLRVKIYGVRGSYPPTTSNITQFGVNTTSIRFDIGKHVVIIDAGTGIINLGNDLLMEMKSGASRQNLSKIHLLFTHSHIDHLMGFPYFMMNYIPKTEIDVISPKMIDREMKEILNIWMSPAFFPVTMDELPSTFNFFPFGESKSIVFFENNYEILPNHLAASATDVIGKISCLRNFTHPKGGSYIYKVQNDRGTIVFATDIEGYVGGDNRLVQFAANADILIHDAQYNEAEYNMFQGFGHSTYQMACEVAQKAAVKKLLLSHHDPKHNDVELSALEAKAQKLFSETYMAGESMEFTF